MAHISDIKLIRTDTTLDLSQKAEKGELLWLHSQECDSYDKFSPSYKSVWMMRNIIHFYNLANQAIDRAAGVDGSDGYLHSHQTSLGRSFLPLSVSEV
ncbi:hypothetical protein ISN45_At01g016960 [Arabidopsis thaliana x Arabidopsis arenosa]|nr:hypothetical protein ISN45_At01g016960 [Arabidopsis thaliana x Arabidopsis arenosa]